ncbi:MAG TPA: protein kinase [Streptosporangiaceae bacterium]|nr:protein kinase [Streptosporangiaceae bacterium]
MSDDVSPPWALGWLPAGSLVAGYRLEDRIGQGGMAVVFRAHDGRLNRRVALKLLAPVLAADAAFRQRFVGESLAAAAVDDPHIIPVFEAGEADGVLFIAMRYVAGGDVLSLVRRGGPLPLSQVAAIISPVASALDAAHAAGLVHRDVKPANMLLDVAPGRPDHVYLSDFGLSKGSLAASGLTGSGQFLGTLDYISPEQIEGRPVDGRADQYALGCSAFELLTGEPPFQRDQGLAVAFAHVSASPPAVTSRRPGLPAGVDEVLAQAMAKAPSARFATCAEFAAALRAALSLPPYDIGSADGPPRRTATQVAELPTTPPPGTPVPPAVTPAPAESGPPTLGAGPATVDAGRAAVVPPRETAPGKTAVPAPDQARGWRPGRRMGLIALAGAALAAAVTIAAIISLAPGPTGHHPKHTGHRATTTGLAPTPTTAYVANYNDNTVTPIDLATGSTGTPIQVGNSPAAIAITPDGKTAYVADLYGNTVTPVDLVTGSVGSPIQVGVGPDAIAITPDGKTAYVANGKGNGDTVRPIDLATGSVGSPIQVGSDPDAIAITPDGKTAYVANMYGNTVTPIDLATGSAGTPIQVGSNPDAIAITPDGKTAYVANFSDDTVTPIDLATGSAGTPIRVGIGPAAIAITSDGKTAYVANLGGTTGVTPIDLATGRVGTTIPGRDCDAIAITPDGKTAYFVSTYNGSNGTVTPIDLVTGSAGTPIQVGNGPTAIALAP